MKPEMGRQGNANVWETLYEHAITESNTELRRRRLREAERAILDRAKALDDDPGEHESEAQALEEAANFIREMKLQAETDGVCKELQIGDKDEFPRGRSPLPKSGSAD